MYTSILIGKPISLNKVTGFGQLDKNLDPTQTAKNLPYPYRLYLTKQYGWMCGQQLDFTDDKIIDGQIITNFLYRIAQDLQVPLSDIRIHICPFQDKDLNKT